ncbi:hypothetical protein HZQ92_17895 [Elizabethkingia anophelis]|nr:hypothetical protein [Elizabethkingia anophelis]MCT3824911.1 hypothetical protein [Elizabethkingia anophelis]MCT3932348.1 hypothetical protein [Elizabethkingia anophelis]MCT4113783.1 hypothetical protein [Elizabethkingia anophelis]
MTSTTNARMLAFRDILKQTGRIKLYNEFDDKLGIVRSTMSKIRTGGYDVHFTVEHIDIAVKSFGANANYLFGVSDKPFR